MFLHFPAPRVVAVEHLAFHRDLVRLRRLQELAPLVRAKEARIHVRTVLRHLDDHHVRSLVLRINNWAERAPARKRPQKKRAHRRLVVYRKQVVLSNATRDPPRERLALLRDLHVRVLRVRVIDHEVLQVIVERRRWLSLGHRRR